MTAAKPVSVGQEADEERGEARDPGPAHDADGDEVEGSTRVLALRLRAGDEVRVDDPLGDPGDGHGDPGEDRQAGRHEHHEGEQQDDEVEEARDLHALTAPGTCG